MKKFIIILLFSLSCNTIPKYVKEYKVVGKRITVWIGIWIGYRYICSTKRYYILIKYKHNSGKMEEKWISVYKNDYYNYVLCKTYKNKRLK